MSTLHKSMNRRRWIAARQAAIERSAYKCERCGRHGRLEVHHRVPLAQGGDPYALANLETLCRQCHGEESGFRPVAGRDAWLHRMGLRRA